MKKTCCAAFLLVMLAQPVLAAEWTDKFTEQYDKFGLDVAVENALADNVKAEDILAHVIKNRDKFSIKMSMKSLYCASVPREVVQETAGKLGIAGEEINKALEESIAECGSKMALQDRDVEKPRTDGNLSGKAPQQPAPQAPVASPPVVSPPAAEIPKLIDTPKNEGKRPSPN